jgi:GNAT superfamily N-acetyltransferase
MEAFPGDPPWNEAEVAVPAKLAVQPELFLVAVDADLVIGPVMMAGYDGHRGWLYALAVLNAHRRRGVGTALVREAEERCWRWGAIRSTCRSELRMSLLWHSIAGSVMRSRNA